MHILTLRSKTNRWMLYFLQTASNFPKKQKKFRSSINFFGWSKKPCEASELSLDESYLSLFAIYMVKEKCILCLRRLYYKESIYRFYGEKDFLQNCPQHTLLSAPDFKIQGFKYIYMYVYRQARQCKEQSQGRRSYDFKQPVCIFSASHVQQPLLIERSGQYICKEQK